MKINIQTSNQNMKQRNKNSYDHYGKCIFIRSMIYTIGKTNVRTLKYKSILNMGDLKYLSCMS